MREIVVASKNPVKLDAVKLGLQQICGTTEDNYRSISVPSGVADQPMSDSETLQGAEQRAKNAQDALPYADLWIGIEGGIDKTRTGMSAYAWVVIRSTTQIGRARTGAFFLPPPIVNLINQGKELGEADDIIFADKNSKQKGGAIGLLSHQVITRTSLYTPAVVMAYLPFLHPELYATPDL